jgi:DNA-binding FadR family transcriptional regulator
MTSALSPEASVDASEAPAGNLIDGLELLANLGTSVDARTHTQIAAALRKLIVLRAIPDDRLPPERELAKTLGVSRMIVREALALLKDDGMVETRPGRGRGTFQRQIGPSPYWRSAVANVRQEIVELVEYRAFLEEITVRIAVRQADVAAMEARLSAAIELMAHDPDQPRFRHADTAFHLTIAAQSGNRHLCNALADARAQLFSWIDIFPIPYELGDTVAEHRAIADAIARRDEAAAVSEVHRHMAHTADHVLRLLETIGSVGPVRERQTERRRVR